MGIAKDGARAREVRKCRRFGFGALIDEDGARQIQGQIERGAGRACHAVFEGRRRRRCHGQRREEINECRSRSAAPRACIRTWRGCGAIREIHDQSPVRNMGEADRLLQRQEILGQRRRHHAINEKSFEAGHRRRLSNRIDAVLGKFAGHRRNRCRPLRPPAASRPAGGFIEILL
ncbi:MAG: hypothetical protein U1F37_03680 [Alphaproteobacteria bacterium]